MDFLLFDCLVLECFDLECLDFECFVVLCLPDVELVFTLDALGVELLDELDDVELVLELLLDELED